LWQFTHLEVHTLIDITRLTRNRVPHNQHKMRIHKPRQSTRVAFGAYPGNGQQPLTITMIGAGDNHLPLLDDPPIT
jgi:hypothetical protein